MERCVYLSGHVMLLCKYAVSFCAQSSVKGQAVIGTFTHPHANVQRAS